MTNFFGTTITKSYNREIPRKQKGDYMIISFIGHSFVPSNGRIKEIVKEEIRKYAYCVKDVTCYLGGYGDFDEICACACRELKKEREGVELFYVTPYIDLSWQQKNQRNAQSQAV